MARAPKKAPAKAAPDGVTFEVATHYHELPAGVEGGVLRVEPGYYIVTDNGNVLVMPPERFAEAYPELIG